MIDFSAPLKAGLSQSELAAVLGVSRITVHTWVNGKMKPHRLHAEEIKSKMEALRRALELNLIPRRATKAPRHEAIKAAIAKAKTIEPAI